MELIFGVGKAIDNMNITAVQNCPTNQRTSVCADGIFRKMLDPFRLRIVSASGIVLTIISHSKHDGIFGVTKIPGSPHNRFENRLYVSW